MSDAQERREAIYEMWFAVDKLRSTVGNVAIRVYRKNRPNVILLVFSKVLFVAGLTFEPENVGEIEKNVDNVNVWHT